MPTVLKKTKVNTEAPVIKKKTVRKAKPLKESTQPEVVKIKAILSGDEMGASFNSGPNPSLLAQYLRVYLTNKRQGNAHTKTRGDVAGSGKKPWKQKGTGRSRVGSIRTPVWRHGGVSHGPVAKDWGLNLSNKMKRSAFWVALSGKVSGSSVFYVNNIELTEGRTKEALNTVKDWGLKGDVLVVTSGINANLLSGTSNLRDVEVVNYDNLNTYQVLAHKNIVFEKDAFEKIKEKYGRNK